MTTRDEAEFLKIMTARFEHCRTLLELSRGQRDLIALDDYSELLALLGRKQQVLTRLDEINRDHPGWKRRWEANRELLDPAVRDDCEHLLVETEMILASLVREEEDSTDFLTERRDATRTQIQNISREQRVREAYNDEPDQQTYCYLDIGK